ncbi:MAG: hypothetical protein JST89_23485 [Cyanobacteria bacterium SZAS-4]|nr:hypothetical protein [Cyanobacteria bacterium SZAS-4]
MEKLNFSRFLFLSLCMTVICAGKSFALPSGGFSSLGNKESYYPGKHQQMYDKQNRLSDKDKDQLEPDPDAFTDDASYGANDQAGTGETNGHEVVTKKPPPQAQKVKEEKVDKELTGWTYIQQGGENKAIPVSMRGAPNWYTYPESRQVSFNSQGNAAKAILANYMPKMPKKLESAMPTNAIMQANYIAAALAAGQLMNAPKRQAQTAKANMGAQQQEISDAAAGAAENGFQTGVEECRTPLINVANEGAGTPTAAEAPVKTHSQAIWMVQQVYKTVYVPMALLFLLPGAILTNLKGYLTYGILGQKDEDAVSPFSGILRSVIAIFLIPGTQLFASWAIDVGNAMTYEVQNYIEPTVLIEWMKEQTFNAPVQNAKNAFSMPKDLANKVPSSIEAALGGGVSDAIAGKIDGGSEKSSQVENQGASTRMMQMAFNMLNVAMNFGMLMLSAFQMVMIAYLFLMAPLAAAFFAWPSGCGNLFKTVFTNWVDALISVSLWKFWWCVVVLIMQTRIEWLMEQGIYIPNSQWEMAVYTAFMVILLYVPFVPFDYKPGEMVTKILQKAEELKSEGAKGAKGGGGGGGGGNGHKGASHSNQGNGTATPAPKPGRGPGVGYEYA